MSCSPTTIRPERPFGALLLPVLILGLVGSPASGAGQRQEYFTELEINDIQMAQEISDRTEMLLWVADRRLLELAPPPEADAEGDDGDGLGATLGGALIRILNPEGARELEELERQRAALDDDLSAQSHADLLRGYVQALEETMDNIDDAWERGRGDVREPIETLRDFAHASLERLDQVESESEDEQTALEGAVEETRMVLEGVGKALKSISN